MSRRLNWKQFVGPALVGVVCGVAVHWIGEWWIWLVVFGFCVGYWDPWPAGRRR